MRTVSWMRDPCSRTATAPRLPIVKTKQTTCQCRRTGQLALARMRFRAAAVLSRPNADASIWVDKCAKRLLALAVTPGLVLVVQAATFERPVWTFGVGEGVFTGPRRFARMCEYSGSRLGLIRYALSA